MSIELFHCNTTQTSNESCILGVVVGDSLLGWHVGYIDLGIEPSLAR